MSKEYKQPVRKSLVRDLIPLLLEDPDTGQEREYVMQEMDGKERDIFFQENQANVIRNNEGKPISVKNFEGSHSKLLKRCVFYAEFEWDEAHENILGITVQERVAEAAIQKWGSKAQAELFEMARDQNGLDKAAEEQEKNS